MGLCSFSELVWTRDSAWGFKCFLPPSLAPPSSCLQGVSGIRITSKGA